MIFHNKSLESNNTFGFSIRTSLYAAPKTVEELTELINSGLTRNNRTLILGGGSNMLFSGDFEGLIIHPAIKGINAKAANNEHVIVTSGAGVEWDELVAWCVNQGLWGAENLSLIPGHTGATAVQNIGAYGVEVADLIDKVYAVDLLTGENRTFSNSECKFGYRDSIFKRDIKGKYVITAVSFSMSNRSNPNTEYGALRDETMKLGGISLENIRNAVINIRRAKLPDPAVTGNAGSFFKNPLINNAEALELKKEHPDAPCYDAGNGMVKVAAGWLIEKCGWKGVRRGDAGVYDKQALVLVNYGKATGTQIIALASEISDSVWSRFGIELEREVEII
jgi:UDP-N-acetylmuramate dehydrogenase